jgi:xanthine dehydrogenase/oxidase
MHNEILPSWDLLQLFDSAARYLKGKSGEHISNEDAVQATKDARDEGVQAQGAAVEALYAWLRSREKSGGHVTRQDVERAREQMIATLALAPTIDLKAFEAASPDLAELVNALIASNRAENGAGAVANQITFWINGRKTVVDQPDPRTLLLDYLRSDDVGLTGTKKVCAQGGCGACTVTLSRWDCAAQRIVQIGINACLRPLCAVDGMAITTIEGIGSTATKLSPVQYQVAVDNGSQCGYCTPGWVMSMHAYLVAHPHAILTQLEVENLFDGNLCRCTGFRPILYAMRHFAGDWGPADEKGSMRCEPWPSYNAKTGRGLIPLRLPNEPNEIPPGIRQPPAPLYVAQRGYTWRRILSLSELKSRMAAFDVAPRLVAGNTSIGIYGEPAQDVTFGPPFHRLDINAIPELHGIVQDAAGIVVGALTTYTELLEYLDASMPAMPEAHRRGLQPIYYMAKRTAGRIVRDAATLGGNTMLVVSHVEEGTPFPSDMFTALCMADASLEFTCAGWSGSKRLKVLDFAAAWQNESELRRGVILERYLVPWAKPEAFCRTYKVALREVNAHSIVNAGMRIAFDSKQKVSAAAIVFGGIGPIAFHAQALESWLIGRTWDGSTLSGALRRVRDEVLRRIEASAQRMKSVPDEGFTASYRTHLAESFFYQFYIWVAEQVAPGTIVPALQSAGIRYERPVSRGTQTYQKYEDEYPVNKPYIKAEAFMQAAGEAIYTHDESLPRGGAHGAPIISLRPLAKFWFTNLRSKTKQSAAALAEQLREKFPLFVDLVIAADIPGNNNQAGDGLPPDPLICSDEVSACGQILAIVLAKEPQEAINIAYFVQQNCIAYGPQTDGHGKEIEPILRLEDAVAQKKFLVTANIWGIKRAGSRLDWTHSKNGRAVVPTKSGGVACRVVSGEQMSQCPQMHFYLETQSALALPQDNGDMAVISSTQNPDTILNAVSKALGVGANHVDVRIRRVGGGYGGKGPRSPWAAANAAVCAAKIRRPVKIAMTREVDSALFGHESPLYGVYHAAIADGSDDPDQRGRLMGIDIHYFMDAGNTADCTPVVMDCTLLRADNGYFVPNYETRGNVCLTNLASNTSFRSLDAISGIVILEDALEAAAHAIGMLPEDVREINLYRLGDFTPYGEVLDYCYLRDVWNYTKKKSDFARRVEAVQAYNRANRWRKRGISLMPVKYGMGFNATFLERGDALIDIYDGDGTVTVRHGGCEIGQGLNTQVIQLVAEALNIPVYLIQVGTTSTAVIPNPISTGASTGTAFNGGAAQKAAQRLRARLEKYCLDMLNEMGREYCIEHHLDFWNYDTGWNTWVETQEGDVKKSTMLWTAIVASANMARINLSVQAQHNEQGGSREDTGLHFHRKSGTESVQNFVGYTYSAACTEVEVDILTGETTILRTDLIYDMGKSINPATDIGQVEGAFVQGVGRVLLENVVWQPSGDGRGINNTPNTWGYKIPATTTIPLELHVDLYPRDNSEEVPENPNLLMSAKECGEPPLCLAATVYFAVKHAILDSRRERGKAGWFRLDMPCTVQRVREACEVELDELTLEV